MKSLFGRAKQSKEQVEREAQADFEAALARAKPPTDAERTWVLPAPDVPDLGVRPPVRQRPRQSPFMPVREAEGEAGTATEEPPATRRRAPKATKRPATARPRRRQS